MLRAYVAGGVDRPAQLVHPAIEAAAAIGRELAVLGQAHPQVPDDAVLHALAQLGVIREHRLPVGLDHHDMAAGDGDVGVAVERHLVRLQEAGALPRLDMSGGGDQRALAIVFEAVGGERHRLVA